MPSARAPNKAVGPPARLLPSLCLWRHRFRCFAEPLVDCFSTPAFGRKKKCFFLPVGRFVSGVSRHGCFCKNTFFPTSQSPVTCKCILKFPWPQFWVRWKLWQFGMKVNHVERWTQRKQRPMHDAIFCQVVSRLYLLHVLLHGV